MRSHEYVPVVQPEVLGPEPLPMAKVHWRSSFRDKVIGCVVLICSIGQLAIAVLDPTIRSEFFTFANTVVAAYVGIQVARNN